MKRYRLDHPLARVHGVYAQRFKNMFGGPPAIPATPIPTPPPTMPDPQGPATQEAARQNAASVAMRAGRSSTVLTTAASRPSATPAFSNTTLGAGR